MKRKGFDFPRKKRRGKLFFLQNICVLIGLCFIFLPCAKQPFV